MGLPRVDLQVLDGALSAGGQPIGSVAVVGIATSGTENSPVVSSDAQLIKDTFGGGQLVDACSLLIGAGVTVVACRATQGTAGSAGTVTATRIGTSDGTLATTGSVPTDGFDVVVEILVSTASVATAGGVFRYSLDGGDSWSESISIPVGTSPQTYTVPDCGVNLVFTNGAGAIAFEDGDLFSFSCTAPAFTVANLQTAYAAVAALREKWRFLWVLGEPADAAGTSALATALGALLDASAASNTRRRYARGLCGAAQNETDAALIGAITDVTAPRVCLAHGPCNWLSDTRAGYLKRQATWPVAMRWASRPASEDLGRVRTGGLPRIAKRADGSSGLYRDESLTPGLTDARVTTLRTLNRGGYYVTEGRLLAAPGSDFLYTQRGTVMDIACETLYEALEFFINDDFAILEDGTLDPAYAIEVESYCGQRLSDALLNTTPPYVSGVQVVVRRDLPNLPADTLAARFRLLPKRKAREIVGEVSFTKTIQEAQ